MTEENQAPETQEQEQAPGLSLNDISAAVTLRLHVVPFVVKSYCQLAQCVNVSWHFWNMQKSKVKM